MRKTFCLLMALCLPSGATAQIMAYTLTVTNLANTPITTVNPGDTFKLRVFVADVRASPQGVFAAYVDVGFAAGLASASGSIVHSATYANVTAGTSSPGVLDEAGGVAGLSPLGPGAFLVFEQTFAASAAGSLTFTANPADLSPAHDNLVYGASTAVLPADIVFGSATLTIGAGLGQIFANGFEG